MLTLTFNALSLFYCTCSSWLSLSRQSKYFWKIDVIPWFNFAQLLFGSKREARFSPFSCLLKDKHSHVLCMHIMYRYTHSHILIIHVHISQTCCTQVPAHTFTNRKTCLHTSAQRETHAHTYKLGIHTLSHWWYKQLRRQRLIIGSWKPVLQRLWGTLWGGYGTEF